MVENKRRSGKSLFDSGEGLSSVAIDLLRILKSRYNYRKLSAMTGFPVSTLTRYLTGKTVPKGRKTLKLLKNLVANVNLSAIIAQNIRNGDGYFDLTPVMLNSNMVKVIGAHVINEFAGTKITSILSLDVLSIPLATYLATATSRPLHIISPEPLSVDGENIPLVYPELGTTYAKSKWLLTNFRRKKESILAVASQTPDPSFFNMLVKVLKRRGAEIAGIFMIVAKNDILQKLNIPPGAKRSFILSD